MLESSLYSENNAVPRDAAKFFVEKYQNFLKWNKEEHILDVGCGDFSSSYEAVIPILPLDFVQLLGVDMSEAMLEIANKKYQNRKINFEVLDITSVEIPSHYHGSFDHMFSFLCLHWVSDQRRAFVNMFNMLKPGGQILVTLFARGPAYAGFIKMGNSQKWRLYTAGLENCLSSYYNDEDPAKSLKMLLSDVGFVCESCEAVNRTFTYFDENVFVNMMCALNPYFNKIPEELKSSFIDEYINAIKNDDMVRIEKLPGSDKEIIHYSYCMLGALAGKPQ